MFDGIRMFSNRSPRLEFCRSIKILVMIAFWTSVGAGLGGCARPHPIHTGIAGAAIGAGTGAIVGSLISNGDVAASAALGAGIGLPVGVAAGVIYLSSVDGSVADNEEKKIQAQNNQELLFNGNQYVETLRQEVENDMPTEDGSSRTQHLYLGPTLGGASVTRSIRR